MIWGNLWPHSYHDLVDGHLSIVVGNTVLIDQTLEHWINDALMAVFFFVVGMEVKREFVVGDLKKPSAAALPIIGALGGMVVPAALFAILNAGGPGSSGWGIPMATDIAFALGIVSLLGNRVPAALKLFLLTLAIVDDIGAILVIAIFYTDELSSQWLLAAAIAVGVIAAMRIARIWYSPAYVLIGIFLWYAAYRSGVHATIAGVILGLFTPAKPLLSARQAQSIAETAINAEAASHAADATRAGMSAPIMRRASFQLRERVSVADRLENLLHPWTSFVIIPLFALANAGVELSGESIKAAATSDLTIGIVLGLVAGKVIGISAFSWLGVKAKLCSLPAGVNWAKLTGISAIAGIGFTVSLFIAKLEFGATDLISEAKIGVLVASVAAAVLGVTILTLSKSPMPKSTDPMDTPATNTANSADSLDEIRSRSTTD